MIGLQAGQECDGRTFSRFRIQLSVKLASCTSDGEISPGMSTKGSRNCTTPAVARVRVALVAMLVVAAGSIRLMLHTGRQQSRVLMCNSLDLI